MLLVRFVFAVFGWIARKVLWFFDLLYGSVPAEFESAFDLDESVRRLSAVTTSFMFLKPSMFAVGEVSRYFVLLEKPRLFDGWGVGGMYFARCFDGEFCNVDGRVSLIGRFTMAGRIKGALTIWFGFAVLFTCLCAQSLEPFEPRTWAAPFIGIGYFALSLMFVILGKRASRDDIPWLSELIQGALSAKTS